MKEYWLSLFPDCFLWIKGEKGLVYNAQSGEKITFEATGLLAQKAELLNQMENLYCIRLTEEELKNKLLNGWVQQIVNLKCGVLVEDNGKNDCPLSLPPNLKIQDKAEYYQWEHRQNIDGNVIENLHSLTFYLNDCESGNDDYGKQLPYPTRSKGVLPKEDIEWFAQNSRFSPFLSEIVLVGNPFIVDGWEEMLEKLRTICPVTVVCMQQDVWACVHEAQKLSGQIKLNIIITDTTALDGLPLQAHYTFTVTSEQEYETAVRIIESGTWEHWEIKPLFTGDNLPFFEECLYMSEEDIHEIKLNKREVFIRQALNIYDFGKLTVTQNGHVYANPADMSVGTVKDTPHSLVYREITEGHSWLGIRQAAPCKDCIYQWLCPSPSHYEAVIGKSNLCHLR